MFQQHKGGQHSLKALRWPRTWRFDDLWVSIFGIPVVGLLMPLVFEVDFRHTGSSLFSVLAFSLVATALIWEGNHFLIAALLHRMRHETDNFRRMAVPLVLCLIYSATVVVVLFVVSGRLFPGLIEEASMRNTLLGAITITVLMNAIYQALYFNRKWRFSFMRAEVLKRENLRSQYESLKHQVNPHFLFSSLSTLSGLIDEDRNVAVRYVQELSAVYRYVLQSKEWTVVELSKEVAFVEMYLFLLGQHYQSGLRVNMEIKPDDLKLALPPLTLQILVENAVKYNTISEERPLYVNVTSEGGRLTVSNNLQLKPVVEEYTKIGLGDIQERYSSLGRRKVSIQKTDKEFRVTVPLVDPSEAD